MSRRAAMVVLGDSFAEGRGDPLPGGGFGGWVPRVAHRLGLPADEVVNLGAFGALTTDVLATQLPSVADVEAPLWGLAVGGNDLVRAYDRDRLHGDLRAILETLTARGATVFTHDYPAIPDRIPGLPEEHRAVLRRRFADANTHLAQLCAELGVHLYRLAGAPLTADAAMWYPDGIHPSAAGHAAIAEEIAAMLAVLPDPADSAVAP